MNDIPSLAKALTQNPNDKVTAKALTDALRAAGDSPKVAALAVWKIKKVSRKHPISDERIEQILATRNRFAEYVGQPEPSFQDLKIAYYKQQEEE
jgi:hypothetical protein